MDIVLLIVLAPLINLIILIVVACCKADERGHGGGGEPTIMSPEDYSTPAGKGYRDDRDIADMIDGRLTNITKNPWKGVL